MLHLTYHGGGIGTPHEPGFCFDKPDGRPRWLFMYFCTPFVFRRDGLLCEGHAGECLLHPPGTPIFHGPTDAMTDGFVDDWFYFGGDDAAKLVEECALPCNETFTIADFTPIRGHLASLLYEDSSPRAGSPVMQACLIAQILVELRRGLLIGGRADESAYRTLSRTRDYILANAHEYWTLERMAKQSGYSVSRFTLLYRRYFDSSPTADLIRARIMSARNLLLYSDHSVSRISELCGFSSLQYFTRTYRELTGETPSETKKSMK